MSQGSRARDPLATGRSLERWLASRLGVSTVDVSNLRIPKAGFSNETVLGTANWTQNTNEYERHFVARIQPTGHQLFTTPDALRQAAVMQVLDGCVPVPKVWLTESDPSVLGAPFFLMDVVEGRVPSDVPSWHRRGWTVDLNDSQRVTLHDNALRALTDLHAIRLGEQHRFLAAGTTSFEPQLLLQRLVRDVHAMYDWCEPVRVHGADVIDAAMRHVIDRCPTDATAGIVWFDARVGNIIFRDDLLVAALVDWEGATLGPPEFDVAWWAMFDEYLCEAQGFQRLGGVPTRDVMFARYEQLSGHTLRHMDYFQILSGLVLSLINSRLVDLLIRNDVVTPEYGAELVTRITTMTERHL